MNPLTILACHMIGDFILQTDYVAKNKHKIWEVRAEHCAIYCVPFWIVMLVMMNRGPVHPVIILSVISLLWITHFIIDSWKFFPDHPWPLRGFMVDQTLHITTLAAIFSIFPLK